MCKKCSKTFDKQANTLKLPTLSSKVLNVTNKANIFVTDINNNNQLSFHGVSWVLPNLQMTIQYYLTCKNKDIKWLNANCTKY